jgi:hypothetical protein
MSQHLQPALAELRQLVQEQHPPPVRQALLSVLSADEGLRSIPTCRGAARCQGERSGADTSPGGGQRPSPTSPAWLMV